MNIDEFLSALADDLEIEDQELTVETYWDELEDFSSMSILIIIAFIDERLDQRISAEQFSKMKQVKDLLNILDIE